MSEPDITEGGTKPLLWKERREDYDPGPLLIRSGIIFVGILIVFIAAIIVLQIWKSTDGKANTESWAALTGLIGWATSQVSIIMSNRFGTTKAAEATQRAAEQRQSRTDTVVQKVVENIPVAVPIAPTAVTPAPATANGIVPAAAVAKEDGIK